MKDSSASRIIILEAHIICYWISIATLLIGRSIGEIIEEENCTTVSNKVFSVAVIRDSRSSNRLPCALTSFVIVVTRLLSELIDWLRDDKCFPCCETFSFNSGIEDEIVIKTSFDLICWNLMNFNSLKIRLELLLES